MFNLAVVISVKKPALPIGVSGFTYVQYLSLQLPANKALPDSGDGLGNWTLAIHKGGLDWALIYWLQSSPVPVIAGIMESQPAVGSFPVPLFLCLSFINK